MPIPRGGGMPLYDLKDLGYKIAIIFGVLIVIYGVLWLLAEFGLIPAIALGNISSDCSDFNWNIYYLCCI